MIAKVVYKVFRSIIFTLTLLVVGLFVLIYTLVSVPAFTNRVKDIACAELSYFLGGEVIIADLDIYPFNEVKIYGLQLYDPLGQECLSVDEIGAGISLWRLLSERKIELTYGEIIGLQGDIVQEEEGGPLNINFLIEALSSKDDNKEKKDFELALRNVVLRKSSLSFRRLWLENKKIGNLDLADLRITNLAADISFPRLGNKEIEVDLRRLSMNIPDVAEINKIGLKGSFSKENISASDITIEFPQSRIYIPSVSLNIPEGESIKDALSRGTHTLRVTDSQITPADFSGLMTPLSRFTESLPLEITAAGNIDEVKIEKFQFGNSSLLYLTFIAEAQGLSNVNKAKGNVSELTLEISANALTGAASIIENELKGAGIPNVVTLIERMGFLSLKGDFAGSMSPESIEANFALSSSLFEINFEGGAQGISAGNFKGQGELTWGDVRIQEILPQVPVDHLNAHIIAEGSLVSGQPEGMASIVVDDFELKNQIYDGFSLNISKEGEFFEGDIFIQNLIADMDAKFSGDIEGEEKDMRLDMDLRSLNLSELTDMKKYQDYEISGVLNLDLAARGATDLTGDLNLSNFNFTSPDRTHKLHLRQLHLEASKADSLQYINMKSDWIDLQADGSINFKKLPAQLISLAAGVVPALITDAPNNPSYDSDIDFDILIKRNNAVPEFFNLPVRLLVPVNISGSISGTDNMASLVLDLPYLQQGKDKLIYDTRLNASIDGNSGVFSGVIETTLPVKKGDLSLNVNLWAHDNALTTDLHWVNTENSDFKGHLVLDTSVGRNELTRQPEITLLIQPSELQMGSATWQLARSEISWADKQLAVKNLRISHDDQFVEVYGVASPEYADMVTIRLADIDVDYVFDMLAINYVTFGGTATGEITGHALLSGNPVAETESLVIKDFTYNGAQLGECVASSRWNNDQKEIEIGADITLNNNLIVKGKGGIWLGRDSLSFDIAARKVPVDFVQPFMAVFSSHVGGYATGDVKLFGTFHDIDMTGKIFADSVAVKLDYTNTIYHGSDSVYLNPGQIEIPHFRLYDKFGNSAMLTGELTHRYFHDPSFNFRLSDANNFLCYDTNSELNPDWYGTLFGTGSANLTGVPGLTDISADMTVSGNSVFTFVLSDAEYARDYQFLTFSDRRGEEARKNQEPTARDIKEMLRQSMKQDEGGLSRFGIDIRATVTPQVLFTLVMDPATGDKITARGRGAMQVKYESDADEMMMYGKYEIEEGNYNFSLQDILLRDFKIKEGSSISFNGNPLAADLDISATYRVNTNLSDLDKSFSTDRDLNRTNVPVDAVLTVTGDMTSPDITFDIELPTLTQDVERKVKSIISTDDMMNRQIIYLLALNRFYTPEYMGAGSNGGELAAVASSTISSQLSNILGQLTDKFSVSPSFRSDKGDFSDIEVDVALSSRLLNNRLLINGNFGYRDRSNSSTTFVGDFDVEYLLSKNGNLRLKAYNHFNDQNYYLREALTTQGLGIVFRKDFDEWFRKKEKDGTED